MRIVHPEINGCPQAAPPLGIGALRYLRPALLPPDPNRVTLVATGVLGSAFSSMTAAPLSALERQRQIKSLDQDAQVDERATGAGF